MKVLKKQTKRKKAVRISSAPFLKLRFFFFRCGCCSCLHVETCLHKAGTSKNDGEKKGKGKGERGKGKGEREKKKDMSCHLCFGGNNIKTKKKNCTLSAASMDDVDEAVHTWSKSWTPRFCKLSHMQGSTPRPAAPDPAPPASLPPLVGTLDQEDGVE